MSSCKFRLQQCIARIRYIPAPGLPRSKKVVGYTLKNMVPPCVRALSPYMSNGLTFEMLHIIQQFFY